MSDSRNAAAPQGAAWLEELKHNRKTQAGLAGFALALAFMAYMLWPEAPKARPRAAGVSAPTVQDSQRALQALDKLPDLAKLGKAGELPPDGRMFRDLFMFDGPPPPPPPPQPPPPPPPPPTEEQLKAQEAQRAKDAEFASRPQSLRYLGYLERKSVGRLGSFMKGEDPLTVLVGDLHGSQWKLVSATDAYAEFQNLKYPDLRHRINATDAGGARGAAVSNEF